MPESRSSAGKKVKQLDHSAALIIVDMQKGFDEPCWGERNNPHAELRVAELLARWRDARAPIIHVHHCSPRPDGCFRPGTAGHKPKRQAIPRRGEVVYRKWVNSAFIGTTLEVDLRRRRITSVVVVGLTTNHCVSTTVRMSGNLGFATFVVSDATATFSRAGADGRLRSAQDVHNAALGDLQEEFAQVVDSAQLLAVFGAGH